MEVAVYRGDEDVEDEASERKRPVESLEGEEPAKKRVKFDSSVKDECPAEDEEKMEPPESESAESQKEVEGVARLPQKDEAAGSED